MVDSLFNFTARDILFEDDVILVVNKPAGLPSQATLDPNRDHCLAAVQRYLKKKGFDYAGLHHRLDAMTSGALLFTKSQAVNASISEQFQSHSVQKKYCAICVAAPDVEKKYLQENFSWCENAPIGEVPGGRVQKFSTTGKKRKPAQTDIKCVKSFQLRDGVIAVYECAPRTGRTHQIRVHLSSLGLCILGDSLYGMPTPRSVRSIVPNRMCLHAQAIEFDHPISGERICIEAPLPSEFSRFLNNRALLNNS